MMDPLPGCTFEKLPPKMIYTDRYRDLQRPTVPMGGSVFKI